MKRRGKQEIAHVWRQVHAQVHVQVSTLMYDQVRNRVGWLARGRLRFLLNNPPFNRHIKELIKKEYAKRGKNKSAIKEIR